MTDGHYTPCPVRQTRCIKEAPHLGHSIALPSPIPHCHFNPFLNLIILHTIPKLTMALNGLAGAGQAKTAILASKGIYAPESKATIQMFGGIFGKSKDKKPSTTSPTTRRTEASAAEQEKENQAEQNGVSK
jgi:hypothetical protein